MKPMNLNRARKARARAEAKRQADENAARFGRTKAEREGDRREAERARRDLDGAKRE
ncbi:uncharacterized protein DUF4169 [Hasllibacter halocynthiae]|uniref:Uncharacterized protein DUF4169 n=1 Tax=Hasllibacter halocynthiae TaxID=595589 RepID=A0A2T0X7Z9_9RHOB|nr:DUF4169 family protein [Hasllibacter halocynthiae]PRY94994.1 uncharacterized protein DUF4169 [Hasllibacter halocynthiae]